MTPENNEKFIRGLQRAWIAEQASLRIYRALADREKNSSRKSVLLKLAENEEQHARRWADRLGELGGQLPPDRETIGQKLWRWVLVQSGTDNALKQIENAEDRDEEQYAHLLELAPSPADRQAITSVKEDEQFHSRLMHKAGTVPDPGTSPQSRLDLILHKESWHKRGGGWIGQAIYGANDGLGSVFGIVSGVAGATAGGPAVLIAGLAGMVASALSMGSGAYLASKAEREVNLAEIGRERKELEIHPEEEMEELSLFYQLKGVPEEEARLLASRLIAQPEQALRTLTSEELGFTEQVLSNPWVEALSASLSTALGAFIPIIPFFFTHGYAAIIASFAISTLAHFLIGAAKTVVTGLSPWKSGLEMTLVGLGEALITYLLGLLVSPVVK
ncbi:MAG TPA: VIT1/CCC1 transporter family protein [Anaerolineales bacterium]|nr:VIT1/CCC1 transporter family protein [Anaerolineales bacterium]